MRLTHFLFLACLLAGLGAQAQNAPGSGAPATDAPSESAPATDAPSKAPAEIAPPDSADNAGSTQPDDTAANVTGAVAAGLVTEKAIDDDKQAEGRDVKRVQTLQKIDAPFRLEGGYWNIAVFGFTAGQLTVSFLIFLIALIFRNIIAAFIFRRLRHLSEKTRLDFDNHVVDAMEKPVSWFIFVLGLYISLAILPIKEELALFIHSVFHGTTMLLIVWAMLRFIDALGDFLATHIKDRQSALYGFVPLIKKSTKIFILCIGILMVIDNLGYNVGGILATLGLGGAAVALASKDTVANFFGSLMIVLDRPFKVGDWIIVGDKVDGDVESIGLRSTKVRTWPKTVMSIPNSILANEYINNWSRMPKRRVKQYVGISYEASADDMEGIVEDIKQLLLEDDGVQHDFILVNFTDFGDSSLDILVYYFTKSTAWLEHMDVRQRINCKIMRAVKERGLSVAFPTRSLYLEGEVARKLAGMDDAPEGRLPGDFGPDAPQ